MKKEIIQTVHDQDLEKLLTKLDLSEKLQNGSLKCFFCNAIITFSNLQGIFKDKRGVKVICDKPECYKKLMKSRL